MRRSSSVLAPLRRKRCSVGTFGVSVQSGQLIKGGVAPSMLATVHPSSLLCMSEEAERKEAVDCLVAGLALVVKAL
jgi:hypothetical protein